MTKWNDSQQMVLDSLEENSNVLVAAAAGSGKTAVLVERIIRSIREEKCNIDELLVVTFMKDAAAQMKAKIIKALEKLCADGGDAALIKQLAIADRADINTIDSFCKRVVKDNFSVLGIDPAFDLYDSAEAKMIHEDVLEDCFEKWYNTDPEFSELSKLFIKRGIDDSVLREIILKIFSVSQSYANEKGFYKKLRTEASIDAESVGDEKWVKAVVDDVFISVDAIREELSSMRDHYTALLESEDRDAAEMMIKMIDSDIDYIDCAKAFDNPDKILEYAEKSLERFNGKKKCTAAFEDAVDYYDDLRKKIRTALKTLPSIEDLKEEMESNRDLTLKLLDYTEKYAEALISEKSKNRKYEFGDIAHFAYRILHDEETGEISPVAVRLRDNYKYIYIDEYQDSNDLQEEILTSIARRDENGYPYNIFMVGDVKQSIYRFRLAKPRLFMDKFDNYKDEKTPGRLINLNMNYRSRREILEGTNFIFRNLMRREFGRIDYDTDAELKTPAEEDYLKNYPLAEEGLNVGGIPEIILVSEAAESDEESGADKAASQGSSDQYDGDSDNTEVEEDDNLTGSADYVSKEELEAVVIADKINEIVNGDEKKGISPLYIVNEKFDNERPEGPDNPRYRRAGYGDITILMGIVSGAEAMVDIFEKKGISARLDNSKGYFDAAEIVTMVSILNVIDNSRMDIPYASVLLSSIGGLTEPELALIVTRRPKRRRYMYDMCIDFENAYIDSEEKNLAEVAAKLRRINGLLNSWKELKSFVTIAELIDRILADTNYLLFVSSMPQGNIRLSNIRMLRYKAECFEKSGFTSLFDFLRYIDKCKIHEEGFGDTGASGDIGNSVQITSIHKSKGLEYPVVILARTGKGFNEQDYKNPVIVDPEQGAAHDVYEVKDSGICIKKAGIKKKCLISAMMKEDVAERMRLLYVAMTRAKEKLIITGVTGKDSEGLGYSLDELGKMKCFVDMILPAVNLEGFDAHFKYTIVSKAEVLESSFGDDTSKQLRDKTEVYEILEKEIGKEQEAIRKSGEASSNPYDVNYQYTDAVKMISKTAVTKLEKNYIERKAAENAESSDANTGNVGADDQLLIVTDDGQVVEADYRDRDVTDDEVRAGQEKAAMRRGTVVHKILELLDYSKVDSLSDMDAEIDRIMQRNFFTDEDRANLNRRLLHNFYSDDESSLFRRMKKASAEGYLYREKSFFMGMRPDKIPGFDLKKESFSDDIVTVQGTMDAFFYEKNPDGSLGITLVDYKTDRVKKGSELIDRYSVQLYLYSVSLSMITDAKINGIIFYCLALGEEVDCREAVEKISREIDSEVEK